MHFCIKCHNMYYIRVDSEDSNKLVYYCRNYGYVDNQLTADNICVSKTQLKRTKQKFNHIINSYTKLDPTLPRINTIKCPNVACDSNKEGDREVIYLRYDDVNMKFVYLCAKCDTMWKTDEQK